MLNKIFKFLLTSGLFFGFSNAKAIAETTVKLEEFQEPELELSLSKDIFKTSVPAVYNLTLNNTENLNAPVPVKIELSKPFLADGETKDPKGTKLKAYVSFIDSSGQEKILSSRDRTMIAKLKPGITKLKVEMMTDRPREYFGGSYEYNFTLTVKPMDAP